MFGLLPIASGYLLSRGISKGIWFTIISSLYIIGTFLYGMISDSSYPVIVISIVLLFVFVLWLIISSRKEFSVLNSIYWRPYWIISFRGNKQVPIPKVVVLITSLFFIAAISSAFEAHVAEVIGDKTSEKYPGYKMKLWGIFEVSKNVLVAEAGAEALFYLGAGIILYKGVPVSRLIAIGITIFSIAMSIWSLIEPSYLPENHPSAYFMNTPYPSIASIIIWALILYYLRKPSVVEFFKSNNKKTDQSFS